MATTKKTAKKRVKSYEDGIRDAFAAAARRANEAEDTDVDRWSDRFDRARVVTVGSDPAPQRTNPPPPAAEDAVR